MFAKGHVQPHRNNVPRRRQRTQSPLNVKSRPDSANGDLTDSGSTTSRTTLEEDRCERPSPGTPLTDESLNVLLNAEKSAAHCDGGPTSPFGLLPPPDPPLTTSRAHSSPQPRVSADGARGHLEPRAANVPRRLNRAQKERERVRQRCFQEVITGSRVWIAFNNGSDCDEDWMWDSENRFGFSGVIRVRVGDSHGECRRKTIIDESGEEMDLVIARQQAKPCDDSGVSALTDSQLESAASFLIEHRQRRNGSGKVLITVPPSRPVESLSIALFALSLPSTSTHHHHHSPSYLSQLRLLPGIIELELHINDITVPKSDHPGTECQGSGYTLLQLVLWHLHDLPIPAGEETGTGGGHGGGLTLKWRGALSLEGIERLEDLVLSR